MDREIEFRAKGLSKDRWYYGYYLEHKTSMSNFIVDLDEKDMSKQHLIDKETLGQYTGKKDLYGTEVYEGDILLDEDEEVVGKVYFDEDDAGFRVQIEDTILDGETISDFRVVGNIWDNPELLEVYND